MGYFFVVIPPIIIYLIGNKNYIIRYLGIVYLVIITGIRKGFGNDYFTYEYIYNNVLINNSSFECGFNFLMKSFAKFGLPFNALLLFISFINYNLIFKVSEKYIKKNKWIFMILWVTYFDFFFYSLSAIRQSLAISIFMYSLKYLKTNKLKYILSIVLASLFHKTALLLLLLLFYEKILKMRRKKIILYYLIFSCTYYVLFKEILIRILPYLSYRYYYYFFLDKSIVKGKSIGGYLAVSLLVFFWLKYKEKINNEVWFCILCFFFLKGLQQLNYITVLPRIQFYFYPMLVIALPQLLNMVGRKYRTKCRGAVILLFFMFFIYKIDSNSKASIYYSGYKTIFNF